MLSIKETEKVESNVFDEKKNVAEDERNFIVSSILNEILNFKF